MGGGGGLVSDSPQLFFTLWALWKYPRSQKENTSQLFSLQPSHSCDTFLMQAEALCLNRAPDENPTFLRANLCLVLNFTLSCWLTFIIDFRNALKIVEFLRAVKKGIRRQHKETGGWMYRVCHWECQCHDLRREGKKISLWSAYLALHL